MAKVAFVLESDYEDSEFQRPYDELQKAGHQATIIGTEAGKKHLITSRNPDDLPAFNKALLGRLS